VAPARENIVEIETAARRAAELCRQMLAYSGQGRFIVENLQLREVIQEMGHLLGATVVGGVALGFNFGDNAPPVAADATQMRQIIMNLVTNTAEAIGENGGEIMVRTGMRECDIAYLADTYLADQLPAGTYATLEVTDSGEGMDDVTRARLFDPFFTTKFTGRGLGLSAVLGIVRAHGGAIKVSSKKGAGTTVEVLLPAADLEAGSLPTDWTSESAAWNGSGTILLVDDEESVLTVRRRMLEKMGFEVLPASDGREALDIFTRAVDSIDCVIMDLTMPQLDGEQAFKEMRRICSNVKVVLSSGYSEQDVNQRFLSEGLAGFIPKPYAYLDLQRVLLKILPVRD